MRASADRTHDELVGLTLNNRWRILAPVFGGPDEGVYVVADEDDGATRASAAIVRVGSDASARGLRAVREAETLEAVAPVLDARIVEVTPFGPLTVVVEAVDPTASMHRPIGATQSVITARNLCTTVGRWPLNSAALGAIHPAVVHREGEVVAPGAALLFQQTSGGSQGRLPAFPLTFTAPEVLNERPASTASAVYAIASCALWWIDGRHPVQGDGWREQQLMASLNALRPDVGGPLIAALGADPDDRPSLTELRSLLLQLGTSPSGKAQS